MNPGTPKKKYKSIEEIYLDGKDLRNFCMYCYVDHIEDITLQDDKNELTMTKLGKIIIKKINFN